MRIQTLHFFISNEAQISLGRGNHVHGSRTGIERERVHAMAGGDCNRIERVDRAADCDSRGTVARRPGTARAIDTRHEGGAKDAHRDRRCGVCGSHPVAIPLSRLLVHSPSTAFCSPARSLLSPHSFALDSCFSSLLSSAMSGGQLASLSLASKSKKKKKVVVKVGMVGDSQIGKTSLMVKYVEGNFNEDYIQTLGQSKTLQ